jgi:hypothetical protein
MSSRTSRISGLGPVLLLAACGSGGGFPDAPAPDAAPVAKFSLSWSVIDQNSQPLPCSRIAGQSMTVLAHNKAFDGGIPEIFTCAGGMGTSQDVVAGTYRFDFELSGTFGVLATAPEQNDVELPADTVTPLMPLTFQVDATGTMALKLASGVTGGNCASGAGIDAVSISVNRASDNSCVDMSFDVSAGAANAAGIYATSCATPADYTGGCIDTDQTLTAANIPSDTYIVHVRGKKAANNCYVNDDTVQSPPLMKTLDRTLNLAKNMSLPGC